MKKVLVIAYLYPPIFNSGTRRSLEFVNHLPDNGWEPTVLTVADPPASECDPSLLDEVRPGTRIVRVPFWDASLARSLGAAFGFLFGAKRIAAGLHWRIRRYWSVPDDCASWIPTAVAAIRELHAETPFDVIYASGSPWSSFLVAERASKLTGVPFVVDYRDLWMPSDVAWDHHTPRQRKHNPALERRVLRAAGGVIATTETFLTMLPQELLGPNRFAITNGFDPADFPPPSQPQDDMIRLVYTGVWRPGYGPDDLFAAVRLLKEKGAPSLHRLRLAVAGFAPGRAAKYGIDELVEEHGRVTHAAALTLMMGASALYLPVSHGFYEHASIPGKLFEYLGSGRQILASAQPVSEVARVLEGVGGARLVAPGDIAALAQAIEQMCEGQEDGAFSPRVPAELVNYTRASLTAKLARALDTVTGMAGDTMSAAHS